MSVEVQRRYGTTTEHSTFVGVLAELTVDTDKKTVIVHDGITPGGNPQDNANRIKLKNINIADFTGKDGYILAYDEINDEFYLKQDSGGGGGLLSIEYFPSIERVPFSIYNIPILTNIDKPV